jgi:hypothetical protein
MLRFAAAPRAGVGGGGAEAGSGLTTCRSAPTDDSGAGLSAFGGDADISGTGTSGVPSTGPAAAGDDEAPLRT